MTTSQQRRSELGAFLRARRGEIARADRGLGGAGRGGQRTIGLRREEVCYFAGISLSWYSWLEQGRDITPSRQVLDAICQTLALTPAEHAYVLSLAGYTLPPERGEVDDPLPGHVQRLLDALEEAPAFALTPHWQIKAWNRSYAALFPRVETVSPEDRNLLWLVFTDPAVRDLLPDWGSDARRFLAEFRSEVANHLGDTEIDTLVQRLVSVSDAFRAWWPDRDVHGFSSRVRRFRHPDVGIVNLEHHLVALADPPDLRLIIYLPHDQLEVDARHTVRG